MFLAAGPYTVNSAASRLSRCRTVERRLRADLDTADLSDAGLGGLRRLLVDQGVEGARLASLLNAVRTYRRFRSDGPQRSRPLRSLSRMTADAPSALIAGGSVPELLRLHGEILAALRARGISRTGNGLVGDYAEWLFAQAFGWRLAGNSERGWDAESPDGERIQIKARRLSSPSASRQLGAIRRLDDAAFHRLGAVLFDADMAILRAALIPFGTVRALARYTGHTNSWRLILSDRVWTRPGVEDVTERLRQVAFT